MESEFEKVDRLMELYVKYEAQVAAAESTFRQQLQGTHARVDGLGFGFGLGLAKVRVRVRVELTLTPTLTRAKPNPNPNLS